MLIAAARVPDRPEARARAAQVTGLARADLDRRLAGLQPRVLIPAIRSDEGEALIATLEPLGFVAFGCDPAAAPADGERLVARTAVPTGGALVVTDAAGLTHDVPARAIALVQRGVRPTRHTHMVTTVEHRLSLGRAVVTGGLVLTKRVAASKLKTTGNDEPFLLVQRSDGEPDVILYERRLNHRALGAEMQASSRANLELLWTELERLAPGRADDRVARPGFVSGLPATTADPVDLALFLVTLARQRLVAG